MSSFSSNITFLEARCRGLLLPCNQGPKNVFERLLPKAWLPQNNKMVEEGEEVKSRKKKKAKIRKERLEQKGEQEGIERGY